MTTSVVRYSHRTAAGQSPIALTRRTAAPVPMFRKVETLPSRDGG